jgi:hypothetical protein
LIACFIRKALKEALAFMLLTIQRSRRIGHSLRRKFSPSELKKDADIAGTRRNRRLEVENAKACSASAVAGHHSRRRIANRGEIMGMKLALGASIALVSLTGALQSAPALADGPKAAYDNGGVADASLDPGEERMTADEENNARLKDLSDAYHNGYNARAKEDAETYSSLRDQLKHPPQQQQAQASSSQLMPPLPEGMPPGEGNAQVKPVQKTQVAQRALPPQPQPQYQQAYQQPQYAPPAPPPQAPRYQPAPQYAAAPAYQEEVTQEEYQEPAYQQEAYEPPPPPPQQAYQYVPVYPQSAYVPQPPVQAVMQPVVTIARPVAYPVYRSAYWAPRYRRTYTVRYGYPAQYAGYGGWE